MCQVQVVTFLRKLAFKGVDYSCHDPFLHLPRSVPSATCQGLSRAPTECPAPRLPRRASSWCVGFNYSPEASVKCPGCFLLGWPAAPNLRTPFRPPGNRMMSPGEQWPLHGSSWGQRLGQGPGPLGETWRDVQGRTKDLAAPRGLCLWGIMLISAALPPTKKGQCSHLLFGKCRETERKQNPPIILTSGRTSLGIQMHFLPVFFPPSLRPNCQSSLSF